MPVVDVVNMQNQKVGTCELSNEVFGVEVREHLFYEVVKAQLASRRQGTAAAKERAAVSGSTKKLYKQKGTGRARHGSIRAPIYVGGGRAHPPVPRDWSYRPPRKVRQEALKSALTKWLREGKIFVLDKIDLPEIKTKKIVGALKLFSETGKCLLVDQEENKNLFFSVRNSQAHDCIAPEGVNVFDILRHDALLVTKSAIKALEHRCLLGKKEKLSEKVK